MAGGSDDLPGAGRPGTDRRADLGDLATFTLDSQGRVSSWPRGAVRLFGHAERDAAGRDAAEVLADGEPGGSLREALAEAAAGRVWTGVLTAEFAGQVSVRCEPLASHDGEVLVIARRVASRDLSMLNDAVAQIGTTLDLSQTARESVDAAVPGFADAAAIFVPERLMAADEPVPHGSWRETVVRRIVARLAGHSPEATSQMLRPGEVIVLDEDSPSLQAMATGRPMVFSHLDAGTAQRLSRRPGGQEFLASYTSFLALPLAARGQIVGCVTFGRTAGSPPFGPVDLALAAQLAARAAVCIDNARLYHREHRTALALQRGMLPGQPEVPAGLEVAQRYLPVGASVVGGDWHDIVPLPGGRAALIVGDAMGHGPEAAAVMIQLRTAAHTLADLGLAPEEVLSRLDRMAAGMAGAPFATCVFAVLDPADSSCVIATAGHLPPVLADGRGTQVIELPPGLPLGLGAESFQPVQIRLPKSSALALYTDGLVESRTRPLDDGMAALRHALGLALASRRQGLDGACAAVTSALRQHGEDDITLVLARFRA